jgi:hypothetical protein
VTIEALRLRLERLLQVSSHEFDLRLEFGEFDALGDGQIVMGIPNQDIPSARYRILKGMALHLLGHYLSQGPHWVGVAQSLEASGRSHFTRLWHAFEDARVENRLIDRWPGARKSLDAKLPPRLGGRLLRTMSRTRQIEWGIFLLGRGLDITGLSPSVGKLLEQARRDIEKSSVADSPEGSIAACLDAYPLFSPHLRGQPEKPLPRPVQAASVEGAEADHGPPAETDGGQSEAEDDLLSLAEGEQRLVVPHWNRPGSSPWFERGVGDKSIHSSAYRSDRKTVIVPEWGDRTAYLRLREEVVHEAGYLARRLKQLIRESLYLRFEGRYRSGKLDMARLWKQRTGSYRLFQRKIEEDARQVAFSLLIDESASMKRVGKIKLATKAAVLLGEALEALEVPLEIIGFSTAHYEAQAAMSLGLNPPHAYRNTRCSPLEHRLYKRFGESYVTAARRLIHIQPRYNNWDEEHLLFAFHRIQAQRAHRRVILVISDGQPNGDATNMIEAVGRVERLGVQVVGIGIGSDYVKQIYRHPIVVSDFQELALELVEAVAHPFRSPRVDRAA